MDVTTNKMDINREDKNYDEPASPFKFYKVGRNTGILTGVIIAVYAFLLESVISAEYSAYLIPIGFIAMGVLYYRALSSYKVTLKGNSIFKNGMLLGSYMSVITAILVAGLVAIFHVIFTRVKPSAFTEEVETVGQFAVFNGILFFETLVFGIIITFIILQGIKGKKS